MDEQVDREAARQPQQIDGDRPGDNPNQTRVIASVWGVIGALILAVVGNLVYDSLTDRELTESFVPAAIVLAVTYFLMVGSIGSLSNHRRVIASEVPFGNSFLNSILGAAFLGLLASAAVWFPILWWSPRRFLNPGRIDVSFLPSFEVAEIIGAAASFVIVAMFVRKQNQIVAVCAFTLGMATTSTLILVNMFGSVSVTREVDGIAATGQFSHAWDITLLSHALMNLVFAAVSMLLIVLGIGRLWRELVKAK